MTRRHTPLQQLKEAKQIARDHGLFVAEKKDIRGHTAYLLYRETPTRNVFVGKRSSPEGIRALVCKAANFH
ncbi:hypothetical protein E6C76_20350 [Pseudothauera nasutitermitis]|uniref:Uncharacterized protein n=1 Tax=Pseudothauera nasutitermitis TaxID=2565930 RepID=A0A4S4ASE5_9RHOO|nr:hypothetical protein [Pseudothauera nasutitermitis]THF61434.1 hypothetical protein E6C76_20350 [Pseudothauera nasutitermitis]